MHYVILRDDDTNTLTPVECLERLYRPFLARGWPVNLAVIPAVSTQVKLPNGNPEGFLMAKKEPVPEIYPITLNRELLAYLRANPSFKIVQHGCHHDYFEFDTQDRAEIQQRLQTGASILQAAGLGTPNVFVAPYDKLSTPSLRQVANRFRLLSTGWFEWSRLPLAWRPKYLWKKMRGAPHWRIGQTVLLTHPGCLLSCYRDYKSMLSRVRETVLGSRLTVLVTHWWEYFREGHPDKPFIDILHETADFLDSTPGVKVVSFEAVAAGAVPFR